MTNSDQPAPHSVRRYSVRLDATISSMAWELSYGTPASDRAAALADHLAQVAAESTRLVDLREAGHIAEVCLASYSTPVADPESAWTTVCLLLDVTVNAHAWIERWGLDPQESLGQYLAAFLTCSRPMATRVAGTVVFVPSGSGRVVGRDTTFAARR